MIALHVFETRGVRREVYELNEYADQHHAPDSVLSTSYNSATRQKLALNVGSIRDIFHFVTVERIPVGNLSLKRRAGGRTALGILQRAESAHLLTDILALLDALDYDSDSDDGEDKDSDDDEAEEDIELLKLMAIFHARRIINLDNPKVMSVRSIVAREISVDMYSDDECWRLLRFRKVDIVKLIGLLNMWYSGYYRAHGFKMQSMTYPSGKINLSQH